MHMVSETKKEKTAREKTEKAFGGCKKCYGKGYSTGAEVGIPVRPCSCDRGNQIRALISNTTDEADREMIQYMKNMLPEYIEAAYPKGKSKERGAATVHIIEFIQHVKKCL